MRRFTLPGGMRTMLRPTFFVAAATAAFVIVACSDSSDAPSSFVDPTLDGGGSTPVPPLGTSDASDEAAADAAPDAEAGIRECSDQGFCPAALPPDEVLRGVWGDGTGIVWAVSDTGHVLRFDGNAWSIHTTSPDNSFFAIWGSGPTDIWLTGSKGLMHGTGASAGAITFAAVDAPGDTQLELRSIWGTGPNDVWAVGGAQPMNYPYPAFGRAVHYTGPGTGDGGTGWTLDNADPIAYATVWGTPKTGVWMQGTIQVGTPQTGFDFKAVVRRRQPGSDVWELIDLPVDPDPNAYHPYPGSIGAAGSSSDTSVWLSGRTRGDYRAVYWHGTSSDNGLTFTWSLIERDAWDLDLTAVWGTAPNDTWAIGDYGRLRRWDGTAWKQAALMVSYVPVTNPLYGIWGKSSDDFWVVGDGIALHKTPGKP